VDSFAAEWTLFVAKWTSSPQCKVRLQQNGLP
jgi:hypothetical protein